MRDSLPGIPGGPYLPALLLVGTEAAGLDRTAEAYRAIKRQIIDLTLPPGSRFTESSLAQQWNISKTPVREALARLRRDGLVTALPRAGYVVSPITIVDTDDLCALRTVLSSEAAAVAARRGIDASVLERLGQLSAVPGALAAGDVDQHEAMRAAIEFEALIANASGNNRLAKLVVEVLDELERVLRMAALIAPEAASPPGELTSIYEPLRTRDAGSARRAVRNRCERVHRDVVRVLTRSASVSGAHIEIPRPRNDNLPS